MASARRRRETAERAVQKALREARKTTTPVTFTGIAKAAGVSTDFIYRHPALRPQLEALRRSRIAAVPDTADRPEAEAAASTLVRRLTQQLATERRKHREETAELRAALEAAHGELLILRRRVEEQG